MIDKEASVPKARLTGTANGNADGNGSMEVDEEL